MIYLSLHTFNAQHLNQPSSQKPKVWFNQDNSVAIFEEDDMGIYDYIVKKAKELRNAGFTMNETNEGIIREYLRTAPPEAESKDSSVSSSTSFSLEEAVKEVMARTKEQFEANVRALKESYPPFVPLESTVAPEIDIDSIVEKVIERIFNDSRFGCSRCDCSSSSSGSSPSSSEIKAKGRKSKES